MEDINFIFVGFIDGTLQVTKIQLGTQQLIDSMAQSVLVFDNADHLVMANSAARALFGTDIKLLQSEGWSAALTLFNVRLVTQERKLADIRTQAIAKQEPVRFYIYRAGERLPCWVSSHREGEHVFTLISVDKPDWTALSDILDKYLEEVREVMHSTQGHTDLIIQSISRARPGTTADQIAPRVTGFARLIDIHMFRLQALTGMVERLERIRTGTLREHMAAGRRRIVLDEYLEDLLEALDETQLVDPENESGDFRRRIQATIPPKLMVGASASHLTTILHDILRNAIMYSMRATPIKIIAYANRDDTAQIDIVDEGYGVRVEDSERVFAPFTRSRQPQIMGEFGYGLSLYLCKHEVEVMNGRLWFESEEGVGTTFSIKIPLWHESSRGSSPG